MKTAFFSSAILLIVSFSDAQVFLKTFTRKLVFTSVVVAIVDHFVHPGHFGGEYAEAIMTGMTAAAFVAMFGMILRSIQKR